MDLKDVKETDVWELYQKSVNYMQMEEIYSDTDKNYRFYNGDQCQERHRSESDPCSDQLLRI